MKLDSTTSTRTSRRSVLRGLVVIVISAALVGLGVWVGSSVFRDTDSVTPQDSELSAEQHTTHLVRSLRIAATSGVTPDGIVSIPEATAGVDDLECGTRFTLGLEDAVKQLYAVEYLSTVAGSRSVDVELWRAQQSQAHDGALGLHGLFPAECAPTVPAVFNIDDEVRFGDGVSIRHLLVMSDELTENWTQLYLSAESSSQREIAVAGLWQVVQWETVAGPPRSPFALVW